MIYKINCRKCSTAMRHSILNREYVCPNCGWRIPEEDDPITGEDPYAPSVDGWGNDNTPGHNGKFL